uniref:NADH dehydrogenase subunit 5 n=1 Tax=Ixodes simplex TaxID=65648 RepID=UPI001FAE7727|nr:NADH dehydrogenase subunit 5 [Ixodes simplex]UNO53618.1 NADH dehydrogenase subunit 5 [Ixodes simplex]
MFLKWGFFLFFKSMLMFMIFMYLIYNYKIILVEFIILDLMSLDVKVYFLLDWVSVSFMWVVLFISSMVMIYSDSYMESDKGKHYFCYMVLLFVFSMLLFIISPNMIMIMLGWDGLGLVSYCLVIYYQSVNSYNSGMITVLSNRIGDVTMLMTIIFLMNYGSLDLDDVKEIFMICGIFILISGMTKSAQIPFSAWLPAAMAAPTPVSSLVHSSTLVTAGIYLLIRFNVLFEFKIYSNLMMMISSMTLFMAGIGANLEMDFKKIIAFSTLSQLGLIMLILSLGKLEFAFFHLLTHALFKSMLFLCAGLVIHSMEGIQDIRYLGNFFNFSPVISGCMGLASLSLFGFPFIGGFYSKDLILEFIYMNGDNFIIIIMVIISTSLTMLYCLRMMYYIIWKGVFTRSFFSKNMSMFMVVPIYFLSIMVMLSGSMMSWMMFSYNDLLVLSNFSKMINILLIIFTYYLFYIMYIIKMSGYFLKKMYFFLSSMWFMSMLSSLLLMFYMKNMSKNSEDDWKWLEELGPSGMSFFLKKNSIMVLWLSNNILSSMVVFFVSILIMFLML